MPNQSAKRKPAKPAKQGESREYAVGNKKPPKEHQFQKGKSGNPHGRPKDLKQLRTMIQAAGHTVVNPKTGMTQIQMMVGLMLISKAPADHQQILKYGWGEVPTELNVNVKDVDRTIAAELARLAGRSQAEDAGAAQADADADPAAPNPDA